MKYILLITFTLLTNCSSNYWDDRRLDLTDSLHLTGESLGIGINANVSTLCVGASDVSGFCGGEPGRVKLGLGGIQGTEVEPRSIKIIGLPLKENSPRSRWEYGGEIPPFASLGVSGGFWVNVGVRADFLEFIDFIGGIFLIDIMDDDLKVEVTDNEMVANHQKWFQSYFKNIQILDDKLELTPDYSKSDIFRTKDPRISLNLNTSFKANNTQFTLIEMDTRSATIKYESEILLRKNHKQMDSGFLTLKNQ